MAEIQSPSIGRIVLYVPESGTVESNNYAAAVPAIVTATFGGTAANLKIFTDGAENTWQGSVPYSEEKLPRSWHWPPRV